MDTKTMIALANMKFKLAKMQADKDAAQDKAAKDAVAAQAETDAAQMEVFDQAKKDQADKDAAQDKAAKDAAADQAETDAAQMEAFDQAKKDQAEANKNTQNLAVYEECSKSSLNKSVLDQSEGALCKVLCADSNFATLSGCADYV